MSSGAAKLALEVNKALVDARLAGSQTDLSVKNQPMIIMEFVRVALQHLTSEKMHCLLEILDW